MTKDRTRWRSFHRGDMEWLGYGSNMFHRKKQMLGLVWWNGLYYLQTVFNCQLIVLISFSSQLSVSFSSLRNMAESVVEFVFWSTSPVFEIKPLNVVSSIFFLYFRNYWSFVFAIPFTFFEYLTLVKGCLTLESHLSDNLSALQCIHLS